MSNKNDKQDLEKIEYKKIEKAIFVGLLNKILAVENISINKMASILGCKQRTLWNSSKITLTALNADITISFCKEYGFDINDIYFNNLGLESEPDENKKTKAINTYVDALMEKRKINSTDSSDIRIKLRSSRSHELDDKHFFGTFYGYCYNSAYPGSHLDSFVLEVYKDEEGFARADLELDCYSEDKYGNEIRRGEKLSGVPLQLGENLIYIVFNDTSSNELYVFAYERFEMKDKSKLSYRRGALLSTCRKKPPYPQIQSFVFSDKPIAKDNLDRVKGFLNLVQKDIIISEKDLNRLKQSNENVRICTENEDFNCESEKMYIINERRFFLNNEDKVSHRILSDALCTLREYSVNPRYIAFPDNEDISKANSKLFMTFQEED